MPTVADDSLVREAVLLVGGQGTRLRPLTNLLPKAVIPVANLPLIAYEIIPLARAGVQRIILAVGYKADALRQILGNGERWGVELVYVEEIEPLDTAGAIGNVRKYLEGPFFACNGDMIYDIDLKSLAKEHVAQQALVTFCLRQTEEIQHFGLVQWAETGRVIAFREKVLNDETGRNTVNSGFYVMAPEVLEYIPIARPYSAEHDLFPKLLEADQVLYAHVPERSGYWADVGRIETYLQANGDILAGALPWFRPEVIGEVHPEARLNTDVCVASNAVINIGAILDGRVSVGEGCIVERGAYLRNSILWPGSRIGARACVVNSVISGNTVDADEVLHGEVRVP